MASEYQKTVHRQIRECLGAEATEQGIMVGMDLYCRAKVPRRHTMLQDVSPDSPWLVELEKILARCGTGYLACLVGVRGVGKTQLAQRAIAQSVAVGRSALYCRAMDLFLHIRSCFGDKPAQTEREVLREYRAPKLLVIDELQERKSSEWEKYTLTNIVDSRYMDLWDTIIIANLTPRSLRESLGASIVDRMRETGGIIECDWGSFRLKKPDDRQKELFCDG